MEDGGGQPAPAGGDRALGGVPRRLGCRPGAVARYGGSRGAGFARSRRAEIDVAALGRRLGCAVVPLVASRGEGLGELKAAIFLAARDKRPRSTRLTLPGAGEGEIAQA